MQVQLNSTQKLNLRSIHCSAVHPTNSFKCHMRSCWGRTGLADSIAHRNPDLPLSWCLEATSERKGKYALFEARHGTPLADIGEFLKKYFGLPASGVVTVRLEKAGRKKSSGSILAEQLEGPALAVELEEVLDLSSHFSVLVEAGTRKWSFFLKFVRRIRCSDLSQQVSLLAKSD